MVDSSSPLTNRIQDIGNQVGQAASTAVEGVKSAADAIGNRAGEFISDATKRAESAGTYLNERAGEAAHAVNQGFQHVGDASTAFAQNVRQTGEYFEERGFEGICTDVKNVIARNPVMSMVAGICVGFCMGRTFSGRRWM